LSAYVPRLVAPSEELDVAGWGAAALVTWAVKVSESPNGRGIGAAREAQGSWS